MSNRVATWSSYKKEKNGVYRKFSFLFNVLYLVIQKKRGWRRRRVWVIFFSLHLESKMAALEKEEGGFWSSALKRNKSRSHGLWRNTRKTIQLLESSPVFLCVHLCSCVCLVWGYLNFNFFFANIIFNGGVASAFDSVPENLVSFSSCGRH